jgi:hypothetical protein
MKKDEKDGSPRPYKEKSRRFSRFTGENHAKRRL